MNLKYVVIFVTFILVAAQVASTIWVMYSFSHNLDEATKDYLKNAPQIFEVYLNSNSSNVGSVVEEFSKEFGEPLYLDGYLYFAEPKTSWHLASSIIKTDIFIDSFDIKYFAGFSEFRPAFFLVTTSNESFYNTLNISMPRLNEAILYINDRFRNSNDPLYSIIKKGFNFTIYPGAYRLDLRYRARYGNTNLILRYFKLPTEVILRGEKKTVNFLDEPPIFVIVSPKTYLSILMISEPIVKGRYLTIKVISNIKNPTYPEVLSYLDQVRQRILSLLDNYIDSYGISMPTTYNLRNIVYVSTLSRYVWWILAFLVLYPFILPFSIYLTLRRALRRRRLRRKVLMELESFRARLFRLVTISTIIVFVSALYLFSLYKYLLITLVITFLVVGVVAPIINTYIFLWLLSRRRV